MHCVRSNWSYTFGGGMPLIADTPGTAIVEKMVAFRKISVLGLDISIRALSAKNITEVPLYFSPKEW